MRSGDEGQFSPEGRVSGLRHAGLAFLVLVLVSAGCSATGNRFSVDLVSHIERGRSTKQDVRRWFGEPTAVRVRSSGFSVWTYTYEERKEGNTQTIGRIISWIGLLLGRFWWTPPIGVSYEMVTRHRLVVFFNDEGVATEYEYSREQLPVRRVS